MDARGSFSKDGHYNANWHM